MRKQVEYLRQLDAAIATLSRRIEQIVADHVSASLDAESTRLTSQRLSALRIYRRALEVDRELTLRQINNV
jgi:hypothetical protein